MAEMAEYIEREAAYHFFKDQLEEETGVYSKGRNAGLRVAMSAVMNNDAIPSADVQPVVRGEWIGYPECLKYPNAYSDDHIVCSACEECFSILDNDCERFNFCPNCSADMREES